MSKMQTFLLLMCAVVVIATLSSWTALMSWTTNPQTRRSPNQSSLVRSDGQGKTPMKDDTIQCISMQSDFGKLLNESHQVYVLMAAKVGGTSMKRFAERCTGFITNDQNLINDEKGLQSFLLDSVVPPRLFASHLYESPQPLIDLIHYGARDSLIIYLYREETDRLMSAIKQVVKARICKPTVYANIVKDKLQVKRTETECKFQEAPFVEEVIKKKPAEIKHSVAGHLSCKLWREIDDTGPAILFAHYKQADLLQIKLSKYFCPSVMPQRRNIGALKGKGMSFVIQRSGEEGKTKEMYFDEWLEAKRSTIEFALKLSEGSCKSRTREIEGVLTSCPDKVVQIFPRKK